MCHETHGNRIKQYILTVRLAPALVLKRVAVTTRLFLGSTAPTAISGVSTTATNFGGAVSTAARPKRIGKADVVVDTGVPVLGEGLRGVLGVLGLATFNDRRPFRPNSSAAGEIASGLFVNERVLRRCGVEMDEVERESDGMVPGRGALGLSPPGVEGVVGLAASWEAAPALVAGNPSSSVHCKCRITDFVAHYETTSTYNKSRVCMSPDWSYRHLCPFGCKPS